MIPYKLEEWPDTGQVHLDVQNITIGHMSLFRSAISEMS